MEARFAVEVELVSLAVYAVAERKVVEANLALDAALALALALLINNL
jgi:hypothetical protein